MMDADQTAAYAVRVPAGNVDLDADLAGPFGVRGLVLFAHGSGSSRHSPRNRQVAAALQRSGYATLLMDLLTADEETLDQRTREHRFDIGLLAARLTAAVDWLAGRREAAARMHAPVDLRVVSGATHLFAEPGALEDVIDLAVSALDRHLPSDSDPS